MENSTNLTWCYQILELTADASEQEIKQAYRKLARKYHPDLNPGDRNAEDRFKQVAQAYQTLLTDLKQRSQTVSTKSYSTPKPTTSNPTPPPAATSSQVRFHVKHPSSNPNSNLSVEESLLRVSNLNKIYNLLKQKKWEQAIDVGEKLEAQFPNDPDVCQWLAIAYHRWAQKLIDRSYYEAARIYLQKALQTDPRNRTLWLEIDRDYKRMEHQLKL